MPARILIQTLFVGLHLLVTCIFLLVKYQEEGRGIFNLLNINFTKVIYDQINILLLRTTANELRIAQLFKKEQLYKTTWTLVNCNTSSRSSLSFPTTIAFTIQNLIKRNTPWFNFVPRFSSWFIILVTIIQTMAMRENKNTYRSWRLETSILFIDLYGIHSLKSVVSTSPYLDLLESSYVA